MNAHRVALRAVFSWVVFLLVVNAGNAQTDALPAACGMTGTGSTTATQRGGQWMTAKDTVNALIVFVQFPDDRYDTTYSRWPTHPLAGIYAPPNFINTYIDSLPSQMSSNGNLTHYFREMSVGRFTLIGKTRFMVTPHTRQWYRSNGWHRWHINKEVLQAIDVSMDFSQFDRWKRYSEYDIRRESDGRVDEIFMIYRNVAQELGGNVTDTMLTMQFYGGESSLGYETDIKGKPEDFYVDNGQRRIGSGHPAVLSNYPGMGTTSVIGGTGDGWFGLVPYRVQIHEFAHHWMSNGPDYGHNGAGFWAMLNHYLFRHNAASVGCINSFERELLGWHYPDSIGTAGGSWYNLSLTDFITTNKSYKLKVPGGNLDEYFRLEYHQRVSQFDTPEMLDPSAKGLYIIHQSSVSNPRDGIRLDPADGRWSWITPEVGYVSWYSGPLPVFKKTGIDRVNGYDDSRQVPFTWPIPPYTSGAMEVILWRDQATNALIEKPLIRGDGNDAFKLGKNTVFSPWSNPNSQNNAKQKTWIAVEVVNETNGVVTFNLHIDSANCLLTSPSKPQDTRLSSNSGQHGNIRFSWAANTEPDLSTYEVWRKVQEYGNVWGVVATTTNTYWVDPEFLYAPGGGDFHPTYRVRAKDTQNLWSNYSDEVTVRAEGANKISSGVLKLSMYSLDQNFPNPFNPSTTIPVSLPQSSDVSITIYNILGETVQAIYSGNLGAGKHYFTWDGKNKSGVATASGMYIVRFTTSAGKAFSSKMILMK